MIEVHVIEDHELPEGHGWMRVQLPDGRVLIFLTQAVARRHRRRLSA